MEAVLDQRSLAVMEIRFCCATMSWKVLLAKLVFSGREDPETGKYNPKEIYLLRKGSIVDEVKFCPHCGEKVRIRQSEGHNDQ